MPAGGGIRQVRRGRNGVPPATRVVGGPEYLPDGQHILYQDNELWLMNPDGTGAKRLNRRGMDLSDLNAGLRVHRTLGSGDASDVAERRCPDATGPATSIEGPVLSRVARRSVDQAEPRGDRRGLGPRGDAQLAEDVRDVDAGRALADEQVVGDPPVGVALGEQREHLAFASRQPGATLLVLDSAASATSGPQLDQRDPSAPRERLDPAGERLG